MSIYPITTVDTANDISLPEYRVGKAYQSITFPGIRQCFAVIGQRQSFLIGTHISPGAHADGVATSFEYLRELGGSWVSNWYVVGPFGHHFSSGPNTAWKSKTDIRSSFTDQFGDTGANHFFLDVTLLREQEHTADFGQGPTVVKADFLDIRATNAGGNAVDVSLRDSHRTGSGRGDGRTVEILGGWQSLNPWLFKRF